MWYNLYRKWGEKDGSFNKDIQNKNHFEGIPTKENQKSDNY